MPKQDSSAIFNPSRRRGVTTSRAPGQNWVSNIRQAPPIMKRQTENSGPGVFASFATNSDEACPQTPMKHNR